MSARLLDPGRRDDAEAVLARALGATVAPESDPSALSVPAVDAGRAAAAGRGSSRRSASSCGHQVR